MTLTADPTGPTVAVTSTDLLMQAREQRRIRDSAEARILELAAEWADAHPDLAADGDLPSPGPGPLEEVSLDEWYGLPPVAWDAPASLAAALGRSTGWAKALIRDVLILRHRLPPIWTRATAGEVEAWRARRIAEAMIGQPDDVVAHVAERIADRAQEVGPVTLDRLIDEAKLRLHAEARELEQLEALDARHVTLEKQSINHTGIAEMSVRGDWADLAAFDDAVAAVAAALSRDGSAESLDARRSMAVGVLADPTRAQALLNHTQTPAPHRRIVLDVHLTEANLLGLDPVALDTDARPLLDQVIRAWCARDDLRLTVRPIRHCGGCGECPESGLAGPHDHTDHAREDYTPSTRDREYVQLRDRHCVFPCCTRPARRCDCDHRIPYDQGGPTCPCNLAPLCRHHHRLKTHAGWSYTTIEPGVYLWTDPYQQRFLRTRDGTTDVTDDP